MNEHGYYIASERDNEFSRRRWYVYDERSGLYEAIAGPYKQKAHAEARALTLAARRVGLVIRDLTKERYEG